MAVSDAVIAVEAGGVNNGTPGLDPVGNVLTNDTDTDAGDTLTVVGVIAGSAGVTSGGVGTPVTGAHGALTLDASGVFTYVVANASAAIQALRVGDTRTDVFTYTIRDAGGLTSSAQLTVTIQGANDAPALATLIPGGKIPARSANGTVVGQARATIMDAGDVVTFSLTNSAGGRFAIHSTSGQITVADSSLLTDGGAVPYPLTVRATDTYGLTSDQTVTIGLTAEAPALPTQNQLFATRFSDNRIAWYDSLGNVDHFTPAPSGYGDYHIAVVADRTGDGRADLLIGSGPGIGSRVGIFDGVTGAMLFAWSPFSPGFIGGVSVASEDVIGDGVADIIIGAGPGAGPHVKVFDGISLAETCSFFAYDPAFRGGVAVAAGDIDGDGHGDIVTGAGPGAGSHVKVFRVTDRAELMSFLTYDLGFVGGVNVAASDVNGDGRPDLVTNPGFGGGADIRAFDGLTGRAHADFVIAVPTETHSARVTFSDLTGNDFREPAILAVIDNTVHASHFGFVDDPTLGPRIGNTPSRTRPVRSTLAVLSRYVPR